MEQTVLMTGENLQYISTVKLKIAENWQLYSGNLGRDSCRQLSRKTREGQQIVHNYDGLCMSIFKTGQLLWCHQKLVITVGTTLPNLTVFIL